MPIYFYDTCSQPYGCFSNFSRHGFELDGFWWVTNEHYFQAQKFATTNLLWFNEIRGVKFPREAAKMGRSRTYPLRKDWEKVKDKMMEQGVLKKFETHADICKILLSTDDELIVENSPFDYYWGCGRDGTGTNQLGLILMAVRKTLRDRYSI